MEKTGITAQRLDMVLGELDQQSIAECFDDVAMYLDQFELTPADKEYARQQAHRWQLHWSLEPEKPLRSDSKKLAGEQKRGDTAIKCVARILKSTERR